jgi:hypothetical protein
VTSDFVSGLLSAIAFAVVAFVAAGGNELTPNTWIQGGLVELAAAVAIAAVLISDGSRIWGGVTVTLFAALAALSYASIAWSVQPANSWLEANRTLSYLAAFAAALLLARLAPRRWRALIGAVATAATAACAYSLLVKVYPATFDPNEPLGRLRAPFDYWNAVGLMGAIGLPACLWAGARREQAPVLRALTVPAVAVLVATVVLSFSRGAVLVAVIGVGIWLALAPLRLRSALILALGAAGGAAISAWGSSHGGISADNVSEATRVSAGHDFGLVIVIALVLSLVAGAVASFAIDRVPVPAVARRRLGYLLIAVVALIPVAGVVELARSHRGFTGEISHLWSRLTNTNGSAADRPGRLVNLSNSRPGYWSLAFKVGRSHPLAGVGADGFSTAQARYVTGPPWKLQADPSPNAHSYVMETFADLGSIGLAISLALLVAWALATRRTLGLEWPGGFHRHSRPPPGSEWPAERVGLIALLAIVVTFGVHSAIDWTWFIPGDAVVAMACAGWLAGRGPLNRAIAPQAPRRTLRRSPGAVALVTSVAAATLVALWAIAEPLRSTNSYLAASAAAIRGDSGAALTDARSAAKEDPVAVDPLFLLSRLYSILGDPAAARAQLIEATSRQPANPRTWGNLGCYDLTRHRTTIAAKELRRALVLEPTQTTILSNPSAFCASSTS